MYMCAYSVCACDGVYMHVCMYICVYVACMYVRVCTYVYTSCVNVCNGMYCIGQKFGEI